MKYEHPSIVIDQPAAGHYVIYGHHPQPAKNVEGQTVVPLQQCYITPEVPGDALIAILEERGRGALAENGRGAQGDPAQLVGMVGLERGGLIAGLTGDQGGGVELGGGVEGGRSAAQGDGNVAIANAPRRCPSGPAGAGAISLRLVPVEVPPGPPGSSLAAAARKAVAKNAAKKGGRK
jgi:hypothetical protein